MDHEQAEWNRFCRAIESVKDGLILFCTGAGISKASGIPTFRGSDIEAVWNRSPMELGTYAFFEETPVGHWEWFLGRFDSYFERQPNPAHYAVTALERWQQARGGRMTVITQNIDLLHDRAGTKELIHIHGDMGHARCTRHGCENGAPKGKIRFDSLDFSAFRAEPRLEHIPRCSACGSLVRIHALLFDEYYTSHRDYRMRDAMNATQEARLMVFVGTSFSVGVTAAMLESAHLRQVPAFSLNPEVETGDWEGVGVMNLQVNAEEALPRLCEAVGASM